MSFPWHHSRGTSYQIPFTRYRKETHSDKELRIAIQRSSICVSRFSSRFSLTLSPSLSLPLSLSLSLSFSLLSSFFLPSSLASVCIFRERVSREWMDTLSNVESETRRSESFAHTDPDNFSSYRDAPPGLLQKRLLDDGDKEEAHGEKKPCALFDGENSSHTGRRHENHTHNLLVNVGIDFQLPVFQKRWNIAELQLSILYCQPYRNSPSPSPLSSNFLPDSDTNSVQSRTLSCSDHSREI